MSPLDSLRISGLVFVLSTAASAQYAAPPTDSLVLEGARPGEFEIMSPANAHPDGLASQAWMAAPDAAPPNAGWAAKAAGDSDAQARVGDVTLDVPLQGVRAEARLVVRLGNLPGSLA